MATSLPQELFQVTLDRAVDRLALTETLGENGGPYMPLISQAPMAQGQIGDVRLFTGDPLFRLVTCSIVVPAIKLDSHMLFAFTPGSSPIPHFTLDAVAADEHFAFHLDLIPRLDLGANLEYMREAFEPLTIPHEQASAIEGLSRAHLSPLQLAIMSPWMLAHRATHDAFSNIAETVATYEAHWFSLLDKGISAESVSDVTTAEIDARNRRNKAMLFNPDVDPVWNRITMLLGEEAVNKQRALLIGDDETPVQA